MAIETDRAAAEMESAQLTANFAHGVLVQPKRVVPLTGAFQHAFHAANWTSRRRLFNLRAADSQHGSHPGRSPDKVRQRVVVQDLEKCGSRFVQDTF